MFCILVLHSCYSVCVSLFKKKKKKENKRRCNLLSSSENESEYKRENSCTVDACFDVNVQFDSCLTTTLVTVALNCYA